MNDLQYHEKLIDKLEQNKSYHWKGASEGLKLHEARIKSLPYAHTPGLAYAKIYCCGLLLRCLQLHMNSRQEKTGWKTKMQQAANLKNLKKITLLTNLIQSLESIYNFYNTINE